MGADCSMCPGSKATFFSEIPVSPNSRNLGTIPPDAFQIFPRLSSGELLTPQTKIPDKYNDKLKEKKERNNSTRIKIVSDHPDANRKKDLKEEEYYFHVTDLAGRGYDYTKDEALKAYQRQLRNPFLPPNISGYKKHQFTNINAPSLNWTTFEVEQQESGKTRYVMKAEENFAHFLCECRSKANAHENCAGFMFYLPTDKRLLTNLNGLYFAIFKLKKERATDDDTKTEENISREGPTWSKIETDPAWGQYWYMKESSELDVEDSDHNLDDGQIVEQEEEDI
mmetsp:Transcript_26919/g.37307  ORF Transcript_26919/g.37307 Transcript_26919/m.37307 type:complete len:282 (+) Transcript_26919:151-996(+)